MNINTTAVINTIKDDIQKKIDMEQKRLDDIHASMKMAEEFLLDNGCDDITQDEDILQNVMVTIQELKKRISINDTDINSIQQSLDALNTINNKIDKNVLSSLTSKISDIKEDTEIITDKLNGTNDFLPILLNLQILCPECKGSYGSNQNTENKRFTNANANCTYCDGVGVISIGKILQNEDLLEDETFNKHNRQERKDIVRDRESIINEVKKQSYSKYNIKRNK